ncbi:MAG: DUF6382 domain-containing protein [Anaerovoracaceae bacterium]|nr:DUF6382 domain-containing protein [Anaerovoracaceae bacterium]
MKLKETNYTLEFDAGVIRPFEEGILTSGHCDFSLPMSFMRCDGKTVVKYNADGYSALSDLIPEDERSILEIIEKTMIMLKRSKEYLIMPGKIVLTKDTVFYNVRTGDLRIAYVAGGQGVLNDHIVDFILSFRDGEDARTREHLDRIAAVIKEENPSLTDIVDMMGEERRDMALACPGLQ